MDNTAVGVSVGDYVYTTLDSRIPYDNSAICSVTIGGTAVPCAYFAGSNAIVFKIGAVATSITTADITRFSNPNY